MKNIVTILATITLHEKNKTNAAGILYYMPIRRSDGHENLLKERLHFLSLVVINNGENVLTHSI